MNERLSSLVDGELSSEETTSAIKALGNSESARTDWRTCHLIGEVMRGETPRRPGSAEAIFARLSAEPTILAPVQVRRAAPVGKQARIALAMAASVVTVSAIGIIALKQQSAPEAGAPLAAQVAVQTPVAKAVSATPAQVNDYLAIHRQFERSGGLQEASFNRAQARKAAGQ